MEKMHFRTLQKIASFRNLRAITCKDELVAKMLADQEEHRLDINDGSVASLMFLHSIKSADLRNLCKGLKVDENIDKKELFRMVREELKLSREEVLQIIFNIQVRVLRNNSIFDRSFVSPTTVFSNPVIGGGKPLHGYLKAFNQFVTKIKANEAPPQPVNVSKVHIEYTIQEAERFLSMLQDEGTFSPTSQLLNIYHSIVDDALEHYQVLAVPLSASAPTRFNLEEQTNYSLDHTIRVGNRYPRILRLQRSAVKRQRETSEAGPIQPTKAPMTVVSCVAGHYPNLLHIISEAVAGFPSSENPVVFMGNVLSPPVKVAMMPSSSDWAELSSSDIAAKVIENSLAQYGTTEHTLHPNVRQVEGLKCLFALLFLKLTLPDAVHLLRGDETLVSLLASEIKHFQQNPSDLSPSEASIHELWRKLRALYNRMPLAATIDNEVFVAHGGVGLNCNRMILDEIEKDERVELMTKELLLPGQYVFVCTTASTV
jgi:hypothetical protein